jgi:large subunit ribosomal protein L1
VAKLTKRRRAINEKVEEGKLYSASEAFSLLKELSAVKFNETVDVAINLGIDPRKSDQIVRGATTLPNGSGKDVRVCVFAQGDAAEAAKAAGAELVGMDELADEIKGGNMDFDVVIAAPDAMRVVGLLGKVLGPRGLMPNPKSGTVTPDVATAVKNAKAGQVRFRADKQGIVHGGIGVITFEAEALQQNLEALMADLAKAKPASAKGIYVKKVTVSSTMGPGLLIDQASLNGGSIGSLSAAQKALGSELAVRGKFGPLKTVGTLRGFNDSKAGLAQDSPTQAVNPFQTVLLDIFT